MNICLKEFPEKIPRYHKFATHFK